MTCWSRSGGAAQHTVGREEVVLLLILWVFSWIWEHWKPSSKPYWVFGSRQQPAHRCMIQRDALASCYFSTPHCFSGEVIAPSKAGVTLAGVPETLFGENQNVSWCVQHCQPMALLAASAAPVCTCSTCCFPGFPLKCYLESVAPCAQCLPWEVVLMFP